jgi:hypothetical protein
LVLVTGEVMGAKHDTVGGKKKAKAKGRLRRKNSGGWITSNLDGFWDF